MTCFYAENIPSGLLPAEGRMVYQKELNLLWKIVVQIGLKWGNVYHNRDSPMDSANLKSSWLEFISAKTNYDPSYAAEYSSAAKVIEELVAEFGRETDPETAEDELFEKLFFDREFVYEENVGVADAELLLTTRLAHAKYYVIDEFIRFQIVAGGFKYFGNPQYRGRNYKGYIGGSRYNRRPSVRSYEKNAE